MVLRCSPRKQFFFSFKNKQKIYIYIFIFSCRVAPEQVCMATICGFPQPQAEDQAWPQGLGPSGTERDGQGGQASAFPFWEAPGRGTGRGLIACPLSRGPPPRNTLSLGPKTSGKGTLGAAQDTGIRGARQKDIDRGVSPQSAPGPWLHCSPARKTSDLPPAHRPSRVWGAVRLQGGPAGSSALANYCDASAPFPAPLLEGPSGPPPAPPFPRP